MATSRCPWGGRRWSSKQYILIALLGTLVAIAIAVTISISLAPGHVSFSIANATMTEDEGELYRAYYNFTVVANNTSRRMAVRYGSLIADIFYTDTSWVPAEEVNTSAAMPGWWPPQGSTGAVVAIWADWEQYNEAENETQRGSRDDNNNNNNQNNNVKWPNCRVHLEAEVWFRYGLIPTMPYTIKASCFPVDFADGVNSTINCTSSY